MVVPVSLLLYQTSACYFLHCGEVWRVTGEEAERSEQQSGGWKYRSTSVFPQQKWKDVAVDAVSVTGLVLER